MGIIIARRTEKEISLFKFYFKTLVKVCNPDEVYISSGFYYLYFWNTKDRPGDTLRDLLSGKNVILAVDPRITKNYNKLKNDLQRDLGAGSVVDIYIHDDPDSNLRSNEIQLIKNNCSVAGIVGSSNCTSRDLDFLVSRESNICFNFQTDVIFFDPQFDNDIITAMSAGDSVLRDADPNSVSVEILRSERRPETDIINMNLKTFITKSGHFRKYDDT